MDDVETEKFDERVLNFQCVGSVRFIPESPAATMRLQFAKSGAPGFVALASVRYRVGVEYAPWQIEEEPLVCRWGEERFLSRRDIDDHEHHAQIILHADRLTLVEVRQVPHLRVVGEWMWRSQGPKRSHTRRWVFEGLLKARPAEPLRLDDRQEAAVRRMLRDWHEIAA